MFWGLNVSPLAFPSLLPEAAAFADAKVVVTIVAILFIWNTTYLKSIINEKSVPYQIIYLICWVFYVRWQLTMLFWIYALAIFERLSSPFPPPSLHRKYPSILDPLKIWHIVKIISWRLFASPKYNNEDIY